MKGIVLAGGSGTRIYPITKAVSKQLLPPYDKQMIYYPISVLMLAGIFQLQDTFQCIKISWGTAHPWESNSNTKSRKNPNGLGEAFIIVGDFIGDENVALILKDHIPLAQVHRNP